MAGTERETHPRRSMLRIVGTRAGGYPGKPCNRHLINSIRSFRPVPSTATIGSRDLTFFFFGGSRNSSPGRAVRVRDTSNKGSFSSLLVYRSVFLETARAFYLRSGKNMVTSKHPNELWMCNGGYCVSLGLETFRSNPRSHLTGCSN